MPDSHRTIHTRSRHLGLPRDAGGRRRHENGRRLVDSDGKIPIESVVHPNAEWPAKTGGSVLRDADTLRIVQVRYRIEINDCRLKKLDAGPRDRERVITHERAHARGWDHWEGTPWTNAAFFPRYRITGR